MKTNLDFQLLINYMIENHYDDFMMLRYDSIMMTSDYLIKNKKLLNKISALDELIKYFEETEDYEKCQSLLDLKTKLI